MSARRFDFRAIHGASNTRHGLALGEGGKIALTEDEGSNWNVRQMYTRKGSDSIHTAVVSETGPGNRRNKDQEKDVRYDLHAIHMAADGMNAWAVGERGKILTTEDRGKSWTVRDTDTDIDFMGLHAATDGKRGWAVGECGVILKTANAWTASDNEGGCRVVTELMDIHFDADGRVGWGCRTSREHADVRRWWRKLDGTGKGGRL